MYNLPHIPCHPSLCSRSISVSRTQYSGLSTVHSNCLSIYCLNRKQNKHVAFLPSCVCSSCGVRNCLEEVNMLKDVSPLQGWRVKLNAFRMLISLSSQLRKCLYVLGPLTTYSFVWKYARKHKRWWDGKWREKNNKMRGTAKVPHRRGEQENVGCSQSIIQKRKVHCAMGAALNMPAWHHLLMGHRLTCYLSWLPPPSPSSSLPLSLSLLLYTVLSVLSGRTCK